MTSLLHALLHHFCPSIPEQHHWQYLPVLKLHQQQHHQDSLRYGWLSNPREQGWGRKREESCKFLEEWEAIFGPFTKIFRPISRAFSRGILWSFHMPFPQGKEILPLHSTIFGENLVISWKVQPLFFGGEGPECHSRQGPRPQPGPPDCTATIAGSGLPCSCCLPPLHCCCLLQNMRSKWTSRIALTMLHLELRLEFIDLPYFCFILVLGQYSLFIGDLHSHS